MYIIWRITRVYEQDEEKVLDLILLTFVGGLISSRIYYILFHLSEFDSILKMVLINRYPGLSFWGGLFGGLVTLKFFCARFKVNFWQIADFGVVGGLIGASLTSLGCLLGSCQYGVVSESLSVTQVGLLGKRFPLQIVEAVILFVSFLYLWKLVLRFHFTGKIASIGLIILGVEKFILEFFRGDQQIILGFLPIGFVWSGLLFFLGVRFYYSLSKRSMLYDLRLSLLLFINKDRRRLAVLKIIKNWYNFKVNLKVSIQRSGRNLLKLLNVKSNPTKF